jgi:hypothetical protein
MAGQKRTRVSKRSRDYVKKVIKNTLFSSTRVDDVGAVRPAANMCPAIERFP